jgi:hypothetical protein
MRAWAPTIVVAVLSMGIWFLAARDGFALEMIWLPGAVTGAAWPRLERTRC